MAPAAESPPPVGRTGLPGIASAFLRLGLTSFGGPIAHLGYLRREAVERRAWMTDAEFADLVALCQLLPGPTSSQVVFGIGMRRAGFAGAAVASACFTLPSAAVMIAFAYSVAAAGRVSGAGWLHGLKLAAVAAVARAVWGMAASLCPDWPRRILGLAAATLVLLWPGTGIQAGAILAAALIGWWALPNPGGEPGRSAAAGESWTASGVVCLVLFAVLLFALPLLARASGSKPLAVFDGFYRSGALVFGGGHVVLPLLRSEIVPRGWLGDDVFLAGYGAVQAVPGPLFSFAAFLGTSMGSGPFAWVGGLGALFALFLPGWLLVAGLLPHWRSLSSRTWFQGAVRGANGAVVGILLAALYRPLGMESVAGWGDAAAVAVALALLAIGRAPPWAVVLLCAALGQWVLR
jgi:chromate transporter